MTALKTGDIVVGAFRFSEEDLYQEHTDGLGVVTSTGRSGAGYVEVKVIDGNRCSGSYRIGGLRKLEDHVCNNLLSALKSKARRDKKAEAA